MTAPRAIAATAPRPSTWLSLCVRTILVLGTLLWLAHYWGQHYVELLLPLYKTILQFALPNFEVLRLEIGTANGDSVVLAQLLTAQVQTLGNRSLPAGMGLDVSTLSGHALKHVIIMLGAVAIWPGITMRARIERLLLSLVPLLLIEAIDIPLTLAGATQNLVYRYLAPGAVDHSLLLAWLRLLDGGARLALPVFAALVVGVLHAAWRDPARGDPGKR